MKTPTDGPSGRRNLVFTRIVVAFGVLTAVAVLP
jgi:hypothetical protein